MREASVRTHSRQPMSNNTQANRSAATDGPAIDVTSAINHPVSGGQNRS